MDSVYVITTDAPKEIGPNELVIDPPSFLEEIRSCFRKKGGSASLGPNYLRAIAEEIGRRYDRSFNSYRNVVPQDFMGRMCGSDEEVAVVVHEMFQARYPVIYQKYYEHLIRARPFSTKVIYFTGSEVDAQIFARLGISKIEESQVPAHLGYAPQKAELPKAEVKTEEKPKSTGPSPEVVSTIVQSVDNAKQGKVGEAFNPDKFKDLIEAEDANTLDQLAKEVEIPKQPEKANIKNHNVKRLKEQKTTESLPVKDESKV